MKKNNFTNFYSLFLISYFSVSLALTLTFSSVCNAELIMKKELVLDLGQPVSEKNLFTIPSTEVLRLTSLQKLKYFEIKKKWKEGALLARDLIKKEKNIAGWIFVSWLNCAIKDFEAQKKSELNFSILVMPLQSLAKQATLLDRGPWRTQLVQLWVKSLQALIEKEPSAEKVAEYAAIAFLRPEVLSTEQKNSWLEKMQNSDIHKNSIAKNQNTGSDNKSQKDSSSPSVMAVPQSGGSAVAGTGTEVAGAAASPAIATAVATSMQSGFLSAVVDTELEKHKKLDALWWQNKRDFSVEPYVNFINELPGGRFSKLWKDRLLEAYSYFWDAKKDESHHILNHLLKLEPSRLFEISQSLFRKADYDGCWQSGEEVLKKGSQNSAVYLLSGKCAIFSGHYERAQALLQRLVDLYSGSEEYPEALFRLGLLNYRVKNYSAAVLYFEKLISSQRDKSELNTRYWYARSLQEMKSEKYSGVRDQIIQDFPFSYYGLKLLAEKNDSKIEFGDATKSQPPKITKIKLTGELAASFQRAEYLQSQGWLLEASAEYSDLVWTSNPKYLFFGAQKLAELKQWSQAIKWANLAFEQNPDLRIWTSMSQFFPQDYSDLIQSESEKRKLSPRLVKSLIRQESAFSLKATSSSNALGLMQMIAPTAAEIARQMKLVIQWPEDMFSPVNNIPMGVFYISQMLEEFKGHVPLALAAYNAGPTKIKLWLSSRSDTAQLLNQFSTETRDEIWFDELPSAETCFYVKAILRNILLYQLQEEKKLNLKPAFWADLSLKNSKTP